jgi:catabolite regulation protein CreA
MKVAGDIAIDCEQPFSRSLDISALNNKSKYIFKQSYLSLSFIKTKIHQLTDRYRIDIAL